MNTPRRRTSKASINTSASARPDYKQFLQDSDEEKEGEESKNVSGGGGDEDLHQMADE